MKTKDTHFKSGFLTIIGKPNVGKSSLMNLMIGEKLSIVTAKPQTTRQNIKGILTDDEKQIVFLDTPGFLEPRYKLQKKMRKYIDYSLLDTDLILFISELTNFPTEYDKTICEILIKKDIPKIAVINKIDLAQQVDEIDSSIEILSKFKYDYILPISVLHNIGIDELMRRIMELLPYGMPYYPADYISDQNLRFFTGEIIREVIFKLFKQEIPYAVAVSIEDFKETDKKATIYANIYVESDSQKKIVIGNKGKMIAYIRHLSEKEIHRLVQKRVSLHLWVKVKPNWRKKEQLLNELGYK